MSKRYLPIVALLLSIPFWWLAAANYPGGTSWDTASPGFSFTANYVSSLFQPHALNGMDNAARPFAFVAMLLYAAGIGCMFWNMSASYPKSAAGKTVQISGVGSMVYAFIAVTTPMHNLLVVIAAVFLAVAWVGMLVLLHRARRHRLVLPGFFNLFLLAILATTTKGNLLVKLGPGCEWILFLSGALWVGFVHSGATARDGSMKDFPSPSDA